MVKEETDPDKMSFDLHGCSMAHEQRDFTVGCKWPCFLVLMGLCYTWETAYGNVALIISIGTMRHSLVGSRLFHLRIETFFCLLVLRQGLM